MNKKGADAELDFQIRSVSAPFCGAIGKFIQNFSVEAHSETRRMPFCQ